MGDSPRPLQEKAVTHADTVGTIPGAPGIPAPVERAAVPGRGHPRHRKSVCHPWRPWALLMLTLMLLAWLMPVVANAQSAAAPSEAATPATTPQEGQPGLALVLDVQGAIGPATTEYLEQGLAEAQERDARVVVLRLDTPGGLVTSLRDINRAILASPIPVITYVAPSGAQAASAGTYMVYASHLAAMAPGTNLGAATPVAMGGAPGQPPSQEPQPTERDSDGAGASGEDSDTSSDENDAANDDADAADDTARDSPSRAPAEVPTDAGSRKALNDAVAYIRSLAELHGRNAEWAEEAVREAASLPAHEALEQNVVEIVAPDLDNLLQQAHGREVQLGGERVTLDTAELQVEVLKPDWRAQFLGVITDPNLAYILLLLGIYGIIFELMNPGAIVPGTIGGISLLTAMLALNMLPINYAGAGLILLGMALMTAEAFVSSFGILGLAGIAAFALGSVFLFDGGIPGMSIDWPVIAVATAVSLGLLAVVLAAVVRAHRRNVVSGNATLVGQQGTVHAWHDGRGSVHVHGETWEARGPAHLAPGEGVIITDRKGLTLQVTTATPGATSPEAPP